MKTQYRLPTIICFIITLLILLSLGTWQVYRLKWKNNITKEISHNLTLPTAELPTQPFDLDKWRYRKVKVKGTFLNDKEIHLYAGSRIYKGQPGYLLLTPLKRDNGEYILVNRGWIPDKQKHSSARPSTILDSETEVEGFLMETETKAWLTPENNINTNFWLWIDIDAIRNYTGINLPDMVLMRKDYKDQELPIGKDLLVARIRNDHLGYAITWYGAALSLVVIFIMRKSK